MLTNHLPLPGQLLADRVKKARAESCCALCGRLISIGQRIGRLADGTGWAHVTCVVAVGQDTSTEGKRL